MGVIRAIKVYLHNCPSEMSILLLSKRTYFGELLAILATTKAPTEEASEIGVYSFLLLAPGVARDFCI